MTMESNQLRQSQTVPFLTCPLSPTEYCTGAPTQRPFGDRPTQDLWDQKIM